MQFHPSATKAVPSGACEFSPTAMHKFSRAPFVKNIVGSAANAEFEATQSATADNHDFIFHLPSKPLAQYLTRKILRKNLIYYLFVFKDIFSEIDAGS